MRTRKQRKALWLSTTWRMREKSAHISGMVHRQTTGSDSSVFNG